MGVSSFDWVGLLKNGHKKFVTEYLKDFNATQAAIRAGYSERTARSQGQRLLTNVDIKEEIRLALTESAMSAEEVLMRFGEEARASIGDFLKVDYSDDGEVESYGLDIEAVKENGHLVKSLTWTKYGPRIELYDSQAARKLIGQHLGMFSEKVEVTGSGGGPIQWQQVVIEKPND